MKQYRIKIKNPIMGVPLRFVEKWNPDEYDLIRTLKPKIGGRQNYERIVIRKKGAS